MLADAEMFCPNRRAARWITRANTVNATESNTKANANITTRTGAGRSLTAPTNGGASFGLGRKGFAYHFLWAHVPVKVTSGERTL